MKLFFNSSMPRSGSELIQVILNQNPDVYASTTSPLLDLMFGARSNIKQPAFQSMDQTTAKAAFLGACKGMAVGWYSSITKCPYVVDKVRGWSYYDSWLKDWNEDVKIICMVRDLRSVVASMERAFQRNRWQGTDADSSPNLKTPMLIDRVNRWLGDNPIAPALSMIQDVYQRQVQDKILFVKYEDLCLGKQTVLDRIYDYLEIPRFEHDFDNIQKTIIEHTHAFGPFGNHDIRPKLEVTTGYKETLHLDIADGIYKSKKWFFETFGYPI